MRLAWIAIAGFSGLALICFAAMMFWTSPAITEGAKGALMFDLRGDGYSYDAAMVYLANLSDPARQLYLGPRRVLDTGLPIGLAGALVVSVYLGLRRDFGRWALVGAMVPSAYFYADLLENAAVATLLRSAQPTPEEVGLASTYTVLKLQLFYASVLLLLLCIIGQGVRWGLNRFREAK